MFGLVTWRRIAALAVTVLVLLGLAQSPAAAHGHAGYACKAYPLSVTLPPETGDTHVYTVVGKLCAEGSPAGKTLQVAVSGFSYNEWYWDPTYHNSYYSYARAAAREGFAVYIPSQLGTGGASDIPPAAGVSLLNQVAVLHQLIVKLRAGKVAHTRFTRVVVVGHSLGAEEAMVLGSDPRYRGDADGLILSDYLHVANQATVAAIAAVRVPAVQTAKYRHAPWADGYLTIADGHRDVFYDTRYADPRMVAADEANKGVASFATAAQTNYIRANPTLTNAITVPVFVVTGQLDSLGCDEATPGLSCASAPAITKREKQFYQNACFRAFVLPRSGHDVNLHYSAPQWFEAANNWADDYVRHPSRHSYALCA